MDEDILIMISQYREKIFQVKRILALQSMFSECEIQPELDKLKRMKIQDAIENYLLIAENNLKKSIEIMERVKADLISCVNIMERKANAKNN